MDTDTVLRALPRLIARVRRAAWPALSSVGLPALAAATAHAHPEDEAAVPAHPGWSAWVFDPLVIGPLAIAATLYARGIWRLNRRGAAEYSPRSLRVIAYWAGWLSLIIALLSPVHRLGAFLFWVHMVQHEILMLVSAPLLALSRPLVPMLWGLPGGWARSAAGLLREPRARWSWALLTTPFVAWAVHGVALWVWHGPALFQATLHNDFIHYVQHLTFFGTGLLFWWSIFHHRLGYAVYGVGVLYVFMTAVHSSILGALLTFAPAVWYPAYLETTKAWGLTALEDQQLAGLIMWVPAGVAYGVIGLLLFVSWMNGSSRRMAGPLGDGELYPLR
ncbi:MAG TPA: cytochrome c oxidase assembly protein [Vicinamibacterales bacterium]|nr:cytochrome c oxidase assembly protein [Vicinamibacterales bacterium]